MARLNQQKAGVLLSYLNLLLGSIIPLAYTPIMLQILGQAEYGLYSLSNSVTSYLALLNLGLGSAIVRYVAKYRAENNTDGVRGLVGMFFLIYSCMAVVVCVGGGILSATAGTLFSKGLNPSEIQRMRILVIIMTLNVAISLPVSTFASVISAYERFVFARTVGIFGTVAVPCFNLVILFLGKGTVGMALVALAMQIVSAAVYISYCSKKLHIAPSFRKMPVDLIKEIAGYCFFIFLSTIVDMLYWATDKVLIGAVLGTVAVAIYNVGGVFTSIMQSLAQAISQVFTPQIMMMATKKKRSTEEISALLIRIGRIQFYIVSFIISGYVVFGQRFIALWAGKDYEQAYYVALLTMIPLGIPLIQSIAYSTMVAENKHQFRAIVYAVIAVINVVLTYLVLPYYGIIGAAACTAGAFLLGNGVIMNIYYHRKMKLDIPRFWRNILRISFIPLIMGVAGWFVINGLLPADNMIVFVAGVAVYSVLFWVFSWFVSMNRQERQMILGMIKRG